MYVYHGPKSYSSLKFFIRKGYKKHSKDIMAVPPALSYFGRRLKQSIHFFSNFLSHFDGAFNNLGYGHYSNFQKLLFLYSILLLGGAAFGLIFIYILNKTILNSKSKTDEDSDIEQEEIDEIITKKNQ